MSDAMEFVFVFALGTLSLTLLVPVSMMAFLFIRDEIIGRKK